MQSGLQWIEEHSPELVELSRAVWGYAEVGLREHRSAAAQADYLEREVFTVERGVAGMPTAFVASFTSSTSGGGAGKPVIGFLGEYDALPGLSQRAVPRPEPVEVGAPGHGCGHNLLGVAALAGAVALARELEARGVPGTVRYYGCPAEENASGKLYLAKHGYLEGLDAALTWHPGQLNAVIHGSFSSNYSVRFAFHGRTAHAAGAPHLGISALDAVELMNVGANYLREHVISDARIHYVITSGGRQPNIVPDFAEVWYYVRGPRLQEVEAIYQRLLKIADGACLMTGASVEVKFLKAVHNYLANPVVTDLLEESMRRAGAPKFSAEEWAFAREIEKSFAPGQKADVLRARHVPREYWGTTLHEDVAPAYDRGVNLAGSTDVSEVSWIAPTGQFSTATSVAGSTGHSWQEAATAGMGIGERGMLVAARTLALAAIELATRPDLLERARAAFERDTEGLPYKSPLPDGMDVPPALATS
jgi:aminobenzoyl-glutamate utilization protein B